MRMAYSEDSSIGRDGLGHKETAMVSVWQLAMGPERGVFARVPATFSIAVT